VGVDADDVYAVTTGPWGVVIDTIGGGAPRRILRGATYEIVDVHIDRRAGRVFGGMTDSHVSVWDLATGVLVSRLDGTGPIWAVRTSPDGAVTIGVGGASPTMWESRTGSRIGTLEGHGQWVRDGAFIDDRIFISRDQDHKALVWDVASARPILTFDDVRSLVVSADRRSVALVGSSGVRVWSPRMPAPN